MSKILVVEDEDKIREVIIAYLNTAGYNTYEAIDGQSALHEIDKQHLDMIILDLMRPDMNGEALCKQIRSTNPVPIIMLTAKATLNHRIQGLSAGADDYIVKPFDPHELLARIRSVLRRTNPQELLADRLEYGKGRLVLDSQAKQVYIYHDPINLTPNEYKLLIVMARNAERTLSREQLIDMVMGIDFEGDTRTIDQHIKNLRQKIKEDAKNPKFIQTIFGAGYRFHGGNK